MKNRLWTALILTSVTALYGCTSTAAEDSVTEEITETAEAEETTAEETAETSLITSSYLTEEDIEINQTIENSEDGGHALEADGETVSMSNALITKTGESSGDEADFYGENAAVYAHDEATLDLSNLIIKTNGTHANAVFSYGSGTTVNIEDSYIYTEGNCSGGLMTTGGGTMNASGLTVHTTGNSSAAIRSDRGGGTVNVNGGSYTTEGKGSPVIYSTADITVSDALLTSTSAQGVVVEGSNSVTLNNCELNASNVSKNSDKSDYYQAVMIYQSMSGDAAEGLASFTMNGGTLTNENGDIFFVNNTTAEITLNNAEIINESDGVFLRAAAAGWGSEGNNGGQVTMYASAQEINGDLLADEVSSLNLYLSEGSLLNGAINPDGEAGEVYVEIDDDSVWTLSADSYITSLSCDADAIDLNGYTLYINGVAYTEGTASEGSAIEVTVTSGTNHGNMPGGEPPAKP